jgi:hypothetical protein
MNHLTGRIRRIIQKKKLNQTLTDEELNDLKKYQNGEDNGNTD